MTKTREMGWQLEKKCEVEGIVLFAYFDMSAIKDSVNKNEPEKENMIQERGYLQKQSLKKMKLMRFVE